MYTINKTSDVWKERADKLREISVLVNNDKLAQSLSWMADAYEQCYEEVQAYLDQVAGPSA